MLLVEKYQPCAGERLPRSIAMVGCATSPKRSQRVTERKSRAGGTKLKSSVCPFMVARVTVYWVVIGEALQNGSWPALKSYVADDSPCGTVTVRLLENRSPRHGLITWRRSITVISLGAVVDPSWVSLAN